MNFLYTAMCDSAFTVGQIYIAHSCSVLMVQNVPKANVVKKKLYTHVFKPVDNLLKFNWTLQNYPQQLETITGEPKMPLHQIHLHTVSEEGKVIF